MEKDSIVIERIFDAPASLLWQAITDKNLMRKWYFDLDNFIPETGFEFQFHGGTEEKKYLHLCKITEVIPERKLSYTWSYDTYPGQSLLTFELFPDGNKTRLKLTHSGTSSFPANDPNFAKKSFMGGWDYIINTSLKNFIEKEITHTNA